MEQWAWTKAIDKIDEIPVNQNLVILALLAIIILIGLTWIPDPEYRLLSQLKTYLFAFFPGLAEIHW